MREKEGEREGEGEREKKVYLLKGQMNTDDILTHSPGVEKSREERDGWMDLTDTAGFLDDKWGVGLWRRGKRQCRLLDKERRQ